MQELKRNTAIVAVTAFGVAERAEPLGPRQSRAEIETLLKATGLDEQMKIAGLWPLWESGTAGTLALTHGRVTTRVALGPAQPRENLPSTL